MICTEHGRMNCNNYLRVRKMETCDDLQSEMVCTDKVQSTNKVKSKKKVRHNALAIDPPKLTYMLMIVNGVVFIVVYLAGGLGIPHLVQVGAMFDSLIIAGEYWRLFTSMFLHFGLYHLVMNMLSLLFIGSTIESSYGKSRMLLIYTISGMLGGIASFVFSSSVSAGASGAIFGLFGAFLFLGVVQEKIGAKINILPFAVIIGVNLGYGFFDGSSDNAAHIGGFIGGFFVAASVGCKGIRNVIRQIAAVVTTITIAGIGLFYGIEQGVSEQDYETTVALATDALENEDDPALAKRYLDAFIEANDGNKSPEIYLTYGTIYLTEGNFQSAIEMFETCIKEDPEMELAHYYLSSAYKMTSDYARAENAINQLIALNPSHVGYQRELESIETLKNGE